MEYSKNQSACEILDGQSSDIHYIVVNDIIYYKDWIYLVPKSQLKIKILKAAHDSPLAGHPRFLKTYRTIRERFTWKGLKKDIIKYVKECGTYQSNEVEHTRPAGLLQPLTILEQKWESISMDFIIGLPSSQGNDCIFVVVDHLTKYTHFFTIPSKSSASQIGKIFF